MMHVYAIHSSSQQILIHPYWVGYLFQLSGLSFLLPMLVCYLILTQCSIALKGMCNSLPPPPPTLREDERILLPLPFLSSTLNSVIGPIGFQGKGLPLVIQVLRDLESRWSGSEYEWELGTCLTSSLLPTLLLARWHKPRKQLFWILVLELEV